jgi:hypothetical protein
MAIDASRRKSSAALDRDLPPQNSGTYPKDGADPGIFLLTLPAACQNEAGTGDIKR